jgi:glutathione peroxidase
MTTVYDFKVKNIKGQDINLGDYKGKTLLIVNVASKCGFTPQYKGLEELQKEFGAKGFAVLGFPCNQFGGQEPGSETEIEQFCTLNFGVSFPMFEKIDVNGPEAHPMFEFLKKSVPGILGTEAIKWNFTKFLVDPAGKVVKRYAPQTKPEDIAADIAKLM